MLNNKYVSGVFITALMTVIAWVAHIAGHDLPTEVFLAITTILNAVIVYFVPSNQITIGNKPVGVDVPPPHLG